MLCKCYESYKVVCIFFISIVSSVILKGNRRLYLAEGGNGQIVYVLLLADDSGLSYFRGATDLALSYFRGG